MRGFIAGAVLVVSCHAAPVDFGRDVKPIFERACSGCHGAKAQMGGLRLDARDLAARAIRPGRAAASPLYQRVAGLGEQARMPMGAKPLAAAEIAIIRDWIDQGAQWPDAHTVKAELRKHWAFTPPVRPALPVVRRTAWCASPIDRFILARLEREGLTPSPEAARATLLRRLSLDLTGLPPTPAELDRFLGDPRPDAYRREVERLLASPHYGERWARVWLDAARYADSDGYEKDKPRQVWFYRDWVIDALNRDLPYNRFLVEQIAGDLLPNATQDERVATGFLRNSMINEEGGVDPEQFRMEAMFDRMDAIGKAVLGVTVQCAQCHNHKYDPIAQEEYYRLFAYLNNSHEANIAVYTPEERAERDQIGARIAAIEAGLRRGAPDWARRMASWEAAAARAAQPEWTVIRPEVDDISTGGQRYLPMPDGSLLALGYAPTKHKVKLTARIARGPVTAIRLELMNDPNLPLGGPGRSIRGTGALTEFEVEAAPAGDPAAKPTRRRIARATADLNLPETPLDRIYYDKTDKRRVTGPIEFAIDGKDETSWGHDAGPERRNLPRKAVFQLAEPINYAGGAVVVIYLSQRAGGWNSDDNQNQNLGRFRLSVTASPNVEADPLPAAVRAAIALPAARRTRAQQDAVFSYWRATVPEWKAANDEIEALWRRLPEGGSQLVLAERAEPRQSFVLARGDFLKPGKPVAPGVPAFLNPLPAGAPANRLGLALWLTDRSAPTTARAMVNRVWQQYFGIGVVATVEDLGRQSEAPSHPELLDWLAVEFMEKGWSLKQLHRAIVTSAAYRQRSTVSAELLAKDPYNRLLARGPRFRVDAEAVRDIALAAAGLLNQRVGGPSVFPPAPAFLFQPPASYGPKVWSEAHDATRYRRALYTFRYRSVPYPMLQTFDAPNGDSACVRRSRSNTPLQALTTLNEPLFVEAARALAERTLREGGAGDAERARYAFRLCASRTPEAEETAELLALLAKQTARGKSGVDAWMAVARVILNLDETITKE
jgi:hypothetical protein